MRLKSIKLAGFKSFVDPTTIPFPSQISAVIGPNGCGKSNVIDAVRWVMGESSAKHLRGESLADVIFNGSNARKPISQASIELTFDNSEGKLGGEYAKYNEIAVKRLITRDGQSHYFLNNTRCRRKDITDVFLGTGLGPRSYAIIEQGTISRLIEAKPDELRHFIEEAAGISKYKERRRETETRMQQTKENLSRIDDIRLELEKQLERLDKQSQTAQKYKQLKSEERQLRGTLHALQWQNAKTAIESQDRHIQLLSVSLEAELTKRTQIDAQMITLKTQLQDQQEAVHQSQAQFYEKNSQIAKLEQIIQHQKERSIQIEKDLVQLQSDNASAIQTQREEETLIATLNTDIQTIRPQFDLQQEKLEQVELLAQDAEESLRTWQQRWNHFQQQASHHQKTAELEQSRLTHLEEQLHKLSDQTQKLEKEKAQTLPEGLMDRMEQAVKDQEALQIDIEQQQHQLQLLKESTRQHHTEKQQLQSELTSKNKQYRTLENEQLTLQTLQKAEASKNSEALDQWIRQYQYEKQPLLSQIIDVEGGWEKAVENVLGATLHARCFSELSALEHTLPHLKKGSLEAIDSSIQLTSTALSSRAWPKLLEKISFNPSIESPPDLRDLLGGIYCLADFAEAFTLRAELSEGESFVTPEGLWVSANRVSFQQKQSGDIGPLARKNKIEALQKDIEALKAEITKIETRIAMIAEMQENTETQIASQQQTLQQQNKVHATRQAEVSAQKARKEEWQKRFAQIDLTLTEIQQERIQHQQSVKVCRQKLEDAIDQMGQDTDERHQLQSQEIQQRNQQEQTKQQAKAAKTQLHILQLQLQAKRTEYDTRKKNIAGLHVRCAQLQERQQQLQQEQHKHTPEKALIRAQLEALIEEQQVMEQLLTSARQILDQYQSDMRSRENLRTQTERQVESVRGNLESARIERQSFQSQHDHWLEQLKTLDESIESILPRIDANVSVAQLSDELEKMSQRIHRLGAINLAAIEEYETEKQRKDYLDQQANDLYLALSTLEKAIQKIDAETKAKFRDTFDTVNQTLGQLFPKIFGGGSAYLELTGQDLLDTGVTIMARPPGKKNSTIHLLSGGEKALTAISLVFSIFQLNPAPFCMLDEVDAPLDDTNVGRLSKLITQMSEQVQFIYITHNKIAMECAHQLIGVTMQEPGVSRIVSVNIDEAIEMVKTS